MTKTIAQLTASKTGKVLQSLRNLIIVFEENGYNMGDGGKAFLAYMHKRNLQQRSSEDAKICSVCGRSMDLYSVNSTTGDQVGNDFKSQWWCGFCDNSIYSLNTPDEEWKLYIEGANNGRYI